MQLFGDGEVAVDLGRAAAFRIEPREEAVEGLAVLVNEAPAGMERRGEIVRVADEKAQLRRVPLHRLQPERIVGHPVLRLFGLERVDGGDRRGVVGQHLALRLAHPELVLAPGDGLGRRAPQPEIAVQQRHERGDGKVEMAHDRVRRRVHRRDLGMRAVIERVEIDALVGGLHVVMTQHGDDAPVPGLGNPPDEIVVEGVVADDADRLLRCCCHVSL